MNKTLSVSAIQHGTVIDHIYPGQALRIIQMLKLIENKHCVTVGLNLSSRRLKHKDLIKIEDHNLEQVDADKIMILAPDATINIIKKFEVIEKIITKLPKYVSAIFTCQNPMCITNAESVETFFEVKEQGKLVKLVCRFCEKVYDRDQLKLKN